jgi:hypothetical protein
MFSRYALAVLALFSLTLPGLSWDGVDTETRDAVEIERNNLVRTGRDVEVYDYNTGQYHDVTVESIRRSGRSVEVEVYDNTTNQYRTLEFDD